MGWKMKPELPERIWEPTRIIEVDGKYGREDLQLWASRPATLQDQSDRREFLRKWDERK